MVDGSADELRAPLGRRRTPRPIHPSHLDYRPAQGLTEVVGNGRDGRCEVAAIGQGATPPIAVEVRRGPLVESVHRAHIAVTDADGRLTHHCGDPEALIYARSSLKPLLAAAMTRLGFAPRTPQHAALAASSHSGEPFHLEGVQAMLEFVGLGAEDLDNTPDWPFDEEQKLRVVAAGGRKSRLAANCSGKHAAMLATCSANGWPIHGYRSPNHPLQLALAEQIADMTGADPGQFGVDGCGALIWATPLSGLAAAFSALVGADADDPAAVIRDGMREAPEYVAGTTRDATALMRSLPGAIAKDGADAVYTAGLPDGTGIAIKIEDGGARARPAAIYGTLVALGLPADQLQPVIAGDRVLGGGEPAGQLRSVVRLVRDRPA